MAYRGSRYVDRRSPSCVYVGNLPDDVKERQLEDLFYKFGRIVDIDIKKGRTTNGTAYAFVEFDSIRDAEKAVERRDGYLFDHTRLRVELTGERRPRRREGGGGGGPMVGMGGGMGFGGPPQRTEYRAVVSHLPQGCRWQHLKDHMRKAGDVGYANVEGGRGIVEYMRYDDLRYAVDKLDGSEMIGPFGVASIIKVREDDNYGGGYGGGGYGGGYGRDAYPYSKRRYRSRSSERDYRRPSRSVSYDDKMNKRRSPSGSRRHRPDDDKIRHDPHRRSYSRSRSRSRSGGSKSRSRGRGSVSRSRSGGMNGNNGRERRARSRGAESYHSHLSEPRQRSVSRGADSETERREHVDANHHEGHVSGGEGNFYNGDMNNTRGDRKRSRSPSSFERSKSVSRSRSQSPAAPLNRRSRSRSRTPPMANNSENHHHRDDDDDTHMRPIDRDGDEEERINKDSALREGSPNDRSRSLSNDAAA